MVTYPALLLPTGVAALAVFVTSFIVWAILPHHRKDFSKLPEEDRVMDALRSAPTGMFTFPFPDSPSAQRDAALLDRLRDGPTGNIHLVRPESRAAMGRNLFRHLLHMLVLYAAVAYYSRFFASSGRRPSSGTPANSPPTPSFGVSAGRTPGSPSWIRWPTPRWPEQPSPGCGRGDRPASGGGSG